MRITLALILLTLIISGCDSHHASEHPTINRDALMPKIMAPDADPYNDM